jgi:hypothetical protein
MFLGSKGRLRNRLMPIVGSVAFRTRGAQYCHPAKQLGHELSLTSFNESKTFLFLGLIKVSTDENVSLTSNGKSTCRRRG